MTEHETARTLVKSPPELWAECSDAASLTRHLGRFGEIRITRLEPENAVAWEGTLASGTVRLEPSGWGTRVILTAREVPADVEPEATEPGAGGPTSPAPRPSAPPAARPGLLRRLLGRFVVASPRPAPVAPVGVAPVTVVPPPPSPPPATRSAPEVDPGAVLTAALDSLGQAHHRPFSRG